MKESEYVTRVAIIAGFVTFMLNALGAFGWFIVSYRPYTVSSAIALATLYYVLRVGWPMSAAAVTIAIIAGGFNRSWRPLIVALISFVPNLAIIWAAYCGVFPSA